jgi:hypothetical protein
LTRYPKKEGGKWPDKNVALRELTAEFLAPGAKPVKLQLANPRADFSQRGWEVARAIDGNRKAGWAFSPKAAEPHVAVFDFAKPISGGQLRLTLDMEYGLGLIFESFRLSASTHPVNWLTASLDPVAGLEKMFSEQVYGPTRELKAQLETTQESAQGCAIEDFQDRDHARARWREASQNSTFTIAVIFSIKATRSKRAFQRSSVSCPASRQRIDWALRSG